MPEARDNILITGANGMLGHAISHALGDRGVRSAAFSRAQLDVTNLEQIRHVFADVIPTLVINCAAYTNVDRAETEQDRADAVNGEAPGTLAGECFAYGAKFVHFSTDFVFNGRNSQPFRPNDPMDPLGAYGRSKAKGEREMSGIGPDDLIIRTSWLYGPNGPNFVQTMLNAARAGKPLTVVDDQIGSPTFTHDLAEATLDLIDRGATGIFHATNSGQTTWFEFAKAIFEEFQIPNVDLKPISSKKWKEMRPTSAIRPAYSALDCSETEKLIGRKLPDWRDALTRYRKELETADERR